MNAELNSDFAEIDRHFAKFIGQFGGDAALVPLIGAVLSRSVREGNICWPLGRRPSELFNDESTEPLNWPSAEGWRSLLKESRAVGGADEETPLVIDGSDRLYLRRYWDYQERLGRSLLEKAAGNNARNLTRLGAQEEAVEAALANRLTIISGGPGTGKTTTVLQILARLLELTGNERLRIALAAPTGKAAARLEQTIRSGLDRLQCPKKLKERIPQNAVTIHRLLGRRGNSVYFRHDADNPLPIDFLVIDEASMVALPLLCKVLDALPPLCGLLLLGDHEQLASVEPGAVLADMVEASASDKSALSNAVVTLKTNYRFGVDSGVFRLSDAVRKGDVTSAVRELRHAEHEDLVSREIADATGVAAALSQAVLAGFSAIQPEQDPGLALARLESFRVLTPLRRGRFGVEGLNREIERILFDAGVISEPTNAGYAGKPILIMQNDHQLQLYNGDVGVLLPDPGESENPRQLWAWFVGKENVPRRFAPARLPEHATAYAMTVHKSQGSEFDRVLFVLPDADSPVLTRELIYTGLTRARSEVELWWNETVFAQAVGRRAERASGLRDLLGARTEKARKPHAEQLSLFE